MRVKKLIKSFEFSERNRSQIVLDSDARLVPNENRIELVEDSEVYSSSGVVKTWVTNPSTVKQWLGFDVVATHEEDFLGQEITSLSFRLGDGTDEYFWNGATWEVNVLDWNTEAEVATNIVDFSIVEKKLQVITRLETTDTEKTPKLYEIKVLWASDVEFQEDLVVRTLIPLLREQLRPISDYPATLAVTTSTVDMTDSLVSSSFPLRTPYNVAEIDSVYNHTDDPDHDTDLFSSFNVDTMVITLNASVDAGKVLWVRFAWEPEVALSTGQEYDEVEKVPMLQISDVNAINEMSTNAHDSVRDKDAGTVVKVRSPRQRDLDITFRLLTNKQSDLQRFVDEMRVFFDSNLQITSVGMDEKYDLVQTAEFDGRTSISQKEIFGGMFGCRILSALFYTKQEQDEYLVQNLDMQLEI